MLQLLALILVHAVHGVHHAAVGDYHVLELGTERRIPVHRIRPFGAGSVNDALFDGFVAGIGCADAPDRVRTFSGRRRHIRFGGEQLSGRAGQVIYQTGELMVAVLLLLLLEATMVVSAAAARRPKVRRHINQQRSGRFRIVVFQVQLQSRRGRSAVHEMRRHRFVSAVGAVVGTGGAIVRALVHGFANAQMMGGRMQGITSVFAVVMGLRVLRRNAGQLDEFVVLFGCRVVDGYI